MSLDPAVALALRAALALLFAAAAVHKLRDFSSFRAAFAAYDLVPASAAGVAARATVALEIALSIALIAGSRPAPFGAAALLTVYALAIGVNLARGRRDLDCGCAGPASRSRISEGLVARNLILAGLALAASLPATARPFVWLDAFTVAAAVLSLALVHLSSETILANAARLRGAAA